MDGRPDHTEDATGSGTGAAALVDAPLTVDDLFEALARPANRYVLTYLLLSDDPVSYHDLVEFVVERTERPPDLTPGEYRSRILARLLHAAVPRLAELGLLRYDRTDETVAETPYTSAVRPYVRIALRQQGIDPSDAVPGTPTDGSAPDGA